MVPAPCWRHLGLWTLQVWEQRSSYGAAPPHPPAAGCWGVTSGIPPWLQQLHLPAWVSHGVLTKHLRNNPTTTKKCLFSGQFILAQNQRRRKKYYHGLEVSEHKLCSQIAGNGHNGAWPAAAGAPPPCYLLGIVSDLSLPRSCPPSCCTLLCAPRPCNAQGLGAVLPGP